MNGRASREPARWPEARVQLIKENFVPLAVRAAEQWRQDAEGEFIRQCHVGLMGASANVAIVTAGGRRLDAASGNQPDPRRALQEWKRLPCSETAPGAVRVGEQGPTDPVRSLPMPPPGGLILKLYYRHLTLHAGKEMHRAEKKDFLRYYEMKNDAFFEAQPDFLWLTEAEWKSLLPDHPRRGDTAQVPAAITERLFLYHLIPLMVYGEASGWQKKDIRAGKLSLIVEEAGKDNVRLRLEGFAWLGADFETASKHVREKKPSWGFEPRLLGYLEYHPTKKKITRFDFVALGDTYGMIFEDYAFYRPGRHPLGVAFGLVDANVPANRVFPRRAPGGAGYRDYFATGK